MIARPLVITTIRSQSKPLHHQATKLIEHDAIVEIGEELMQVVSVNRVVTDAEKLLIDFCVHEIVVDDVGAIGNGDVVECVVDVLEVHSETDVLRFGLVIDTHSKKVSCRCSGGVLGGEMWAQFSRRLCGSGLLGNIVDDVFAVRTCDDFRSSRRWLGSGCEIVGVTGRKHRVSPLSAHSRIQTMAMTTSVTAGDCPWQTPDVSHPAHSNRRLLSMPRFCPCRDRNDVRQPVVSCIRSLAVVNELDIGVVMIEHRKWQTTDGSPVQYNRAGDRYQYECGECLASVLGRQPFHSHLFARTSSHNVIDECGENRSMEEGDTRVLLLVRHPGVSQSLLLHRLDRCPC